MRTNHEVKLLLQFCKQYLHQESIVPSKNRLTGDSLLALALYHRITVPLFPYLLKWLQINGDTQNENLLRAHHQKAKVNTLKFTHEIVQFLQLFEKSNLFCFCLKGPIGAQQIFDDYTAKDSRDIDLLIDESKIETYLKIIQENGYTPTFDYQQLNTKQKRYFRKANNQLGFFHKEKKVLLEIHWRLFANDQLLSFSKEQLKSNSQTIKIANHSISVFSDEHLLFYLVTHGAKHKWSKLYWLLEVAFLVNKKIFDWPEVFSRANELGILRPLTQGMALIEELFHLPLPKEIAIYYKKSKVTQQLVQTVRTPILSNKIIQNEEGILFFREALIYRFKLKKDIRYKLAYLNSISIKDFELVKLPQALFFGYFWLRPFLWIWRYLIRPTKK